jgi:hypothetical protein
MAGREVVSVLGVRQAISGSGRAFRATRTSGYLRTGERIEVEFNAAIQRGQRVVWHSNAKPPGLMSGEC